MDTNQYVYSHSKQPSGTDGWGFEIEGETIFFTGTYSAAKAKAITKAKKMKATTITVLP